MDRYCVMGNPVDHSKSPWIHARFAELTGEPHRIRQAAGARWTASPQACAPSCAEGGKGCNVTVPFKFEAARLAGCRSARAALAGACNMLRFEADGIHGDNTDGIGLVADLQQQRRRPAGAAATCCWWAPAAPRRACWARCWKRGRAAWWWPTARWPRRSALVRAPRDAGATTPRGPAGLRAARGARPLRRGDQRHRHQHDRRRACRWRAACCKPGALACDMMYGPGRAGLPAVGARARRGGPRRPGHAGGAGGRSLPVLARRAAAERAGAGRAARGSWQR